LDDANARLRHYYEVLDRSMAAVKRTEGLDRKESLCGERSG
jgi:hypothetical protein